MTTAASVPTFSGEVGEEIQPGDFLKKFRVSMRQIAGIQDAEKIENFGDHLKSNLPAEEWYNDPTTPKATWAGFQAAFTARFPGVVKAKKTGTDLERELREMRLSPSELGKTERFGGEDVWTHVAFADKALDLAKRAGIDTGSSSIWAFRDELPDILKEKVSENQLSWQTFCTAIKGVELGHIRDGVKKYKEQQAVAEQLARLEKGTVAPPSPTAGIRNQMTRTNISTNRTSQTNTTNTNPFNSNGGGKGNLFAPTTPRPPATENQRQAFRALIAAYPMQPNTPEGTVAYLAQLQSWKDKWGDQKVTEHTGFPLRPGSDAPGSGECYACGKTGHIRGNCTASGSELTIPQERDWRAICGSVLGHRRATPMNVVGTAEGDDLASWMQSGGSEPRGDQGNAKGPSA